MKKTQFLVAILWLSLTSVGATSLGDVFISAILSPVDNETIPMTGSIIPAVTVRSISSSPESLWLISRIEHTCSTYVWRDSAWFTIQPMEVKTVFLDTWLPRYPGLHRFQSALGPTDTTPWYHFWVLGGAGIEEPSPPMRHDYRLAPIPSFVRGVLDMPPETSRESQVVLLSTTGRKVLDLQPGPNDISRFAPGIYFIRSTSPNHYWGRKLVLMK